MKFRTGIYFPVDGVTLLILSPFIILIMIIGYILKWLVKGATWLSVTLIFLVIKTLVRLYRSGKLRIINSRGITTESRAGLFDRHGSMIRW